jgi:hypothetical protein
MAETCQVAAHALFIAPILFARQVAINIAQNQALATGRSVQLF